MREGTAEVALFEGLETADFWAVSPSPAPSTCPPCNTTLNAIVKLVKEFNEIVLLICPAREKKKKMMKRERKKKEKRGTCTDDQNGPCDFKNVLKISIFKYPLRKFSRNEANIRICLTETKQKIPFDAYSHELSRLEVAFCFRNTPGQVKNGKPKNKEEINKVAKHHAATNSAKKSAASYSRRARVIDVKKKNCVQVERTVWSAVVAV